MAALLADVIEANHVAAQITARTTQSRQILPLLFAPINQAIKHMIYLGKTADRPHADGGIAALASGMEECGEFPSRFSPTLCCGVCRIDFSHTDAPLIASRRIATSMSFLRKSAVTRPQPALGFSWPIPGSPP
jgi:hypothetical protein